LDPTGSGSASRPGKSRKPNPDQHTNDRGNENTTEEHQNAYTTIFKINKKKLQQLPEFLLEGHVSTEKERTLVRMTPVSSSLQAERVPGCP
jgi:hypothetical protein